MAIGRWFEGLQNYDLEEQEFFIFDFIRTSGVDAKLMKVMK